MYHYPINLSVVSSEPRIFWPIGAPSSVPLLFQRTPKFQLPIVSIMLTLIGVWQKMAFLRPVIRSLEFNMGPAYSCYRREVHRGHWLGQHTHNAYARLSCSCSKYHEHELWTDSSKLRDIILKIDTLMDKVV